MNSPVNTWTLIARPFYRFTISIVPRREELPVLLNRRRLLGSAVEVGVQQGLFSDLILSSWQGSRLISVDPWLESADYEDTANVAQATQESLYQETVERLARHGARGAVWRMTSQQASDAVPDASLDFVYIDARHDHDSVRSDLEAWYPKVRPGGILAGHDYFDDVRPEGVYGVRSAVDEFVAALQLPFFATTFQDGPSWIIEKPLPSQTRRPIAWHLGVATRRLLVAQRRWRDGTGTAAT